MEPSMKSLPLRYHDYESLDLLRLPVFCVVFLYSCVRCFRTRANTACRLAFASCASGSDCCSWVRLYAVIGEGCIAYTAEGGGMSMGVGIFCIKKEPI